MKKRFLLSSLAAALTVALAPGALAATTVQVTVENLAPLNGGVLTPVWLGVHDGTFDLYDSGVAASPELERLAEDGDTGPLSAAFAAAFPAPPDTAEQTTLTSGVVPPVFFPSQSATATFMLDATNPLHRYLSYASMVIPSNDAFVANGNPTAHDLTDGAGNFRSFSFIVLGAEVLDAGTEVNDEVPENTAFLNQTVPNTGTPEGGVVGLHAGFTPGGNILTAFPGADFTQTGYEVARFTITAIPEPESYALMLAGLGLVGFAASKRKSSRS